MKNEKNGRNGKKKGRRVASQPVVEEKGEGRRARWPVAKEKGEGTEISSNCTYSPARRSGNAGSPLSGCFRAPQGVRSSWFGTQSDESRGQTVRHGGKSIKLGKSRHTQTSEKITGSCGQSQEFQDSGTQTVILEFSGSKLSGRSHELIPRKSQNAAINTGEGTGLLGLPRDF